MPIVRKTKAQQHLQRLEERIEKIKQVLQGQEPNMNLWNLYAFSEDDYKRDFTEIDQSELSLALSDIEGAIRELKKVKTLPAQ